MERDILWVDPLLQEGLGAQVRYGPPGAPITGLSIDTRTLEPGDLFFALRGPERNGHEYVENAFAAGAVAAVVEQEQGLPLARRFKEKTLYPVVDVQEALENLGKAGRERSRASRIAITGSVGKTSTKDMISQSLSCIGKVHASRASFNNHIGVPLTLGTMARDAEFGIFELGMNHAGEIRHLSQMVQPHVALITHVGPVHLENFGTLEAIAAAKAEIFESLSGPGYALIPNHLEQTSLLEACALRSGVPPERILFFGEGQRARARFIDMREDKEKFQTYVQAEVGGRNITYTLSTLGRHMVFNSLAVLAIADVLDVDVPKIADALREFYPLKGRGRRIKVNLPEGGTYVILDESYNANPLSMHAALELLARSATRGRRIAILGDMLELGERATFFHQNLTLEIERLGIDLVFTTGPLMRSLFDALPKEKQGGWALESAELVPSLLQAVWADDMVMIKGSNAMRMDVLLSALENKRG